MNTKKCISYILGATGAVAVVEGLFLLMATEGLNIANAITIICLSVAFGILLPNPISFIGLIAGIFMLALPSGTAGVLCIAIGMILMLTNVYISAKHLKLFHRT